MNIQLKRLERVPLDIILKVYLVSSLQGLLHILNFLVREPVTEPNSSAVKVVSHHELKAAKVVEPGNDDDADTTQSTEYAADLG